MKGPLKNMRELQEAAEQITRWLKWDRAMLEDFHAFGHRFGCLAGHNVYEFVLSEALARHGLTLEQFRSAQPKGGR